MNIQYFLATKLSTRNRISCSKNALNLTYAYSNVEFQNFSGRTTRFKGRGFKFTFIRQLTAER
jgi:hypothetical protein